MQPTQASASAFTPQQEALFDQRAEQALNGVGKMFNDEINWHLQREARGELLPPEVRYVQFRSQSKSDPSDILTVTLRPDHLLRTRVLPDLDARIANLSEFRQRAFQSILLKLGHKIVHENVLQAELPSCEPEVCEDLLASRILRSYVLAITEKTIPERP